MTSLRERFEKKDRFLVGAELVSARSLIKPSEGGKIIDFVDGLCKDERVDWVSVTDNVGGNPMQAPLILGKAIIFECKECGDCSLADIAYLCPQSQCAKNQKNGPCEGSLEGKCELKTFGKECIWIRAYDRERYFGKGIPELLNRPPILKDNALKGTSGWANFFLELDHFAAK